MTRLGLPLSGINVFSSPCSCNAGEGLGYRQPQIQYFFQRDNHVKECISRAKNVETTASSHQWKALSPKIQLMNMQCLLLSLIQTNVTCHTDKVHVLWLDISFISCLLYQNSKYASICASYQHKSVLRKVISSVDIQFSSLHLINSSFSWQWHVGNEGESGA